MKPPAEAAHKFRIALNAVSAKSGGAATFIRNLSQSLAENPTGAHYTFFVPSEQASNFLSTMECIKAVSTDVGYRSFWRRLFWDQVTLRRLIKRTRIRVLVSTSDFGMLFPPCRQVLLLRNPLFFSNLYLKHILPRKSLKFRIEFLLRRWLITQSIRHSHMVMTASKSMLDDIRCFVRLGDEKAIVSPFGVPLRRFDVAPRSQDSRPLQLLYISEYSDYKNLTTLLKALIVLNERDKDGFRLVCSADPSQFASVEISSRHSDAKLAGHPSIASSIRFTGRIPYEQVRRFYQDSNVFVFPSIAESFGHPLVEAMASGLPVVASDIPLCREICGDAALYFDPLSAADLAEKILVLRDDADLRQRLGKIGRQRAESTFDWDDYVRRFVSTIGRVTAQ